jgi:predicted  nucleic acid-binding Zn-ribbon protein
MRRANSHVFLYFCAQALSLSVGCGEETVDTAEVYQNGYTDGLAAGKGEIADLEAVVEALQATVDELQLDMDALDSTVVDHEGRIGVLEDADWVSSTDLTDLDDALMAEIDSNSASILNNITDISALDSRVTANEDGILAHDDAIANNRTSIDANTTEILTNETEIATNSVVIAANTANITTNSDAIAALDTRVTSNEEDIVTLGEGTTPELEDLTDRVDQAETDIATNTSDLSSLDTRVTTIESDYLTSVSLSGYATESWVSSQGYGLSTDISSLDTRVTGIEGDYLTASDLSGYATESWVSSQSYLTSADLSGYATETWVDSQGYGDSADITSLDGRVTTIEGDYLASSDLSGYATESWVSSQGYGDGADITSLDGRVSTIEGDYLVSSDLSGYATETWVYSLGYITSTDLSGYATETWVDSQGFGLDADIVTNTEDIYDLETRISANESDISANIVDILQNISDISDNAAEIDSLDSGLVDVSTIVDAVSSDDDGDGWYTPIDCDDDDSAVNPDAWEIHADGIDNNCDGHTDDLLIYYDFDSYIYGDSEIVNLATSGTNADGFWDAEVGDVPVPAVSTAFSGAGNAILFDGSNDYLELNSSMTALSAATVSVWAYWIDTQSWSRVFDFGAEYGDWMLANEGSTTTVVSDLHQVMSDGTGTTSPLQLVEGTISTGTWHHLVTSCGPEGAYLYIDGVLADMEAWGYCLRDTFRFQDGSAAYLAKSNYSTDAYFYGYMDEFKLYSRQLSYDEVQDLYLDP